MGKDTIIVLASPPANVKHQWGLYCLICITPNKPLQHTTKHLQLSNHHELTPAGILDAITSLTEHTGPVNILVHNKPALSTIFSTKHNINAHYAIQANKILLQWLNSSDNNKIYWGWFPMGYTHPTLCSLDLHLGKLCKKGTQPMHPLAATAHRIHKEEQKAQSQQFYHHSNSHILARLTRLLSGHVPIGRYYVTKPYFQWDTRCTCDGQTLQSRNHILDHCPLYIHHWESWLNIQRIKEHPLQELVEFLDTNPLAFTFEHVPIMLPTNMAH